MANIEEPWEAEPRKLLTDREKTLPRWAQVRILSLRQAVRDARFEATRQAQRADAVDLARVVLGTRGWATIPGPAGDSGRDVYHLWFIAEDHPYPACSLGRGDILLIGREQDEATLERHARLARGRHDGGIWKVG